jgi:hypothetical protein
MLAWAAKRKLVKLAKACLPRPRTEQPFGRGNDVTLAIQVAAQIETSLLSSASSEVCPRWLAGFDRFLLGSGDWP